MKQLVFLVSILGTTPLLSATELSQFFLGTKGGYQIALDDNYNYSNPEGTIFGIYGGLQFSPSWSWDVGYQYHNELKADATSVNVKTWLIESALRYDWYLQRNLSLYGRLGASYWDMEKIQPHQNKVNATGFSPLGEVGINYNFSPNVQLSTGYQYIDSIGKSITGKYDSHGLLISLSYIFGRPTQVTLSETIVNAPVADETPKPGIENLDGTSLSKVLTFCTKNIESGTFDFNGIKLSDDFISSLTKVAALLNTYPQAQAFIVGHTDSIGSEAYNKALSERRAQSTTNWLIDLGVTPEQLEWRGEGQSYPVADNKTAEGRAKNRRVEISIPCFQFEE